MPRTRSLSDDVVLERAMSVFWQHGYAGTSLRDLTQATGLSAAALYHRFADKDGLFVAALRRYADEGLVERLARLSAMDAPLDAIQTFLDEIVALSLADPDHRGCLLVNTALDGAPMSDAARDMVRTRLAEVESFFAAQLRRAVASRTLAAATDIPATATALLGTVFAIRVFVRIDPSPARLDALVDYAMASLRATQPASQATAGNDRFP